MCGIQPDGERHFTVAPKPGGHFSHARAAYESSCGRIESGWVRTKDGWRFSVSVPCQRMRYGGAAGWLAPGGWCGRVRVRVRGGSETGCLGNRCHMAGSSRVEATTALSRSSSRMTACSGRRGLRGRRLAACRDTLRAGPIPTGELFARSVGAGACSSSSRACIVTPSCASTAAR
ncbi:MAG: hypothetical protein LKE45_02755 [Olsenella sp.]|nr:hypothetical protein [Olsenella sp.]